MGRQIIIPMRKIGKNQNIHEYILENTNIRNKIKIFGKMKRPEYLYENIRIKKDKLKEDVLEVLKNKKPKIYDDVNVESYLYIPLTRRAKFLKINQRLDNGYLQIDRTEESKYKSLGCLLDSFNVQIIKSRIAILQPKICLEKKLTFLWHKDESVFLNLRINIPIVSNNSFVIQILKDENKRNKAKIVNLDMQLGRAYIYDTERFHRAHMIKNTKIERNHLIIGCSPWFNFDTITEEWKSNEYYGEIHPFDMFKKGYISELFGG